MNFPTQNKNPQSQGILHMALASVFFFFMGLMVKLSEGIPVSQAVFFRALVAMLICLVQLRLCKVSPWGTQPKILILRGLFGTGALIAFFYTLMHMTMATATTIQYLSPIFTTIFTALLLKETFYPKQIFFFALSFVGIVLIKGLETSGPLLPYGIGILGAILGACAYTTIRKIKNSEHHLVIIFYFPLVTLPLVTPYMLQVWVWPTWEQWLSLVGVGVFVQIAQYYMTRSYQVGNAGTVSIVSYLGIIWATVGGYFIFDEVLNTQVVLGIALVLIGVIGNTLYYKYKQRKLALSMASAI